MGLLQPCKQKGQKSTPQPAYYPLISLGKFSLVRWPSGGRKSLEDKINIPFVLLATPAAREIMLFFENGNCRYAFSITHLVYSFFFGF